MPSVLFVCSANQCRSPMAEVLFQQRLEQAGMWQGWRVESAGVWTTEGVPATTLSGEVMSDRGLDLSHHRSQPVNAEMLREFNLILVMEDRHRRTLQREYPEIADRVHLLTAMVGLACDVDDPVSGTIETYRSTASELEDLLERGFGRIVELTGETNLG